MNTQDFGDFGQFVPATPPPPVSASDDDFGDFGQLVPQQAPVGSVEISPPIHPESAVGSLDTEPPTAPETIEKGRMLQAGVAAEAQGKDPSLAVRAAKVHLQPIKPAQPALGYFEEARNRLSDLGTRLFEDPAGAEKDIVEGLARGAGSFGAGFAAAPLAIGAGIKSKLQGGPFLEPAGKIIEQSQELLSKPSKILPESEGAKQVGQVLGLGPEASNAVGDYVLDKTGSPAAAYGAKLALDVAQALIGQRAATPKKLKGKGEQPASDVQPPAGEDDGGSPVAPLADKVKAALPAEPQRTAVADAFAEALKKEPPAPPAPVQAAPVTAPAVETPTVSAPPKSPETVAATAGAPIATADKPRIRVQAGSQPVLEEQTGTIAAPTEAPTKGAVPTVTARKIDENPPPQPAANDAVNLETVPEPAKPAVQEPAPLTQEPTNAAQTGKQSVGKVEQHSGDDVVGTPTQASNSGLDGKRPPAPEPEVGPQAAAQGTDEDAQLPVETKVETKLDAGGGRGDVVSGRLADIAASRERMGQEPLPEHVSTPDTETKAKAKGIDVEAAADDILANDRPFHKGEGFAFADAVAESERKHKELSEAHDAETDPIKKQSLGIEKDREKARHDYLTLAQKTGSSGSGSVLRETQAERTTDLGSELHVVQRATEAKGKPLTPEERAPLEAGARQIYKLEKTAKQARKKASGTKAEKIIAKAGKERRKALQDKEYNDLIDEFLADHEKTLDKCRIS